MYRKATAKQQAARSQQRKGRRELRAPARPFDLEDYLARREREAILRELGCR